MKQSKQKVFLALWPDEKIRRQINNVARSFDAGGKPVPASNLHITLLFIGFVSQQGIECIKHIAARYKAASFELKIDRVNSFKNKTLWLGCSQLPDGLGRLHHALEQAMRKNCQYQPEERLFTPHITIQRKIIKPVSAKLDKPIHWDVNSYSLILSRQGQYTSVYSELAHWDLE